MGGTFAALTRVIVVEKVFLRNGANHNYAIQFLALMPVNYICTQSVNLRQWHPTRVLILKRRATDFCCNRTRLVDFKTRSCVNFNASDLIVKFKGSAL